MTKTSYFNYVCCCKWQHHLVSYQGMGVQILKLWNIIWILSTLS